MGELQTVLDKGAKVSCDQGNAEMSCGWGCTDELCTGGAGLSCRQSVQK